MEYMPAVYGGTTLHRIITAKHCICYITDVGIYYVNKDTGVSIGEALLSGVIAGCVNKYGIYLATASAIYKLPFSSLVSANSTADLELVFNASSVISVNNIVDIDGEDTALVIATSTTLIYAMESDLNQISNFILAMSNITRCKISKKLIVIIQNNTPKWVWRNSYYLDSSYFITSGEYLTPNSKNITHLNESFNLFSLGVYFPLATGYLGNLAINQKGYILVACSVGVGYGLVLAKIINNKLYVVDLKASIYDTVIGAIFWTSDTRAVYYVAARVYWVDIDLDKEKMLVRGKEMLTDNIYPNSAIYNDGFTVVTTMKSHVVTITNILNDPIITLTANSNRHRNSCVSSDGQYITSVNPNVTTTLHLFNKNAAPSTAYTEVFSRDMKLDVTGITECRGLMEHNGWLIVAVIAPTAPTARSLKYQKVGNSWVYQGSIPVLDNIEVSDAKTKKLTEGMYSVCLTSSTVIIISIDDLTGEPTIELTFNTPGRAQAFAAQGDYYASIHTVVTSPLGVDTLKVWGNVPTITEDVYEAIVDIAIGEDIFVLVPSVGIYTINTVTQQRTLLNVSTADMTSIDVTSLATASKGLLAFGRNNGDTGQIVIDNLGGL